METRFKIMEGAELVYAIPEAAAKRIALAKEDKKQCGKCNKALPVSNYERSPTGYLGLAENCNKCKINK